MCSLYRKTFPSNAAAAERSQSVTRRADGPFARSTNRRNTNGMGRMGTLQAAAILNVQQPALARRSVRPI